jgi:hypothetical protein
VQGLQRGRQAVDAQQGAGHGDAQHAQPPAVVQARGNGHLVARVLLPRGALVLLHLAQHLRVQQHQARQVRPQLRQGGAAGRAEREHRAGRVVHRPAGQQLAVLVLIAQVNVGRQQARGGERDVCLVAAVRCR